MKADPMAMTQGLAFVGMAGIIDPLRAVAKERGGDRAQGRDRRAHDHRRPPDHRRRHRRSARARAGRDQRHRLPGAVRRGGRPPPARAARVRPRDAGGQAAARASDAGRGPDRRDDRRRGQRRGRAQAGRHRRRDGQRQRGHQAGRADDPHRRQLRHARARRRARPPRLRQGRRLRALPDDAAAVDGDAVRRRHRVQHQRRRRADPADGAVPPVLRDGGGRDRDRDRPRRPRRHEPAAARPEAADRQSRRDHVVGDLRGRAVRGRVPAARDRAGRAEGRTSRASR